MKPRIAKPVARVRDPYKAVAAWARRMYGPEIGAGLYRRVFLESPTHVIKVPRNEWGDYCNEGEAQAAPTDARYARCEMFAHAQTGVCLLRMERVVRFPTRRDDLPGWTHSIDCQQVGWTADGRLVAYDWVYPRHTSF